MPRENLYFIALITPDAISAEITGFKNDMAQNYSTKAALKSMPHITLKAPFNLPAENHAALLHWFANLGIATSPFEIDINNFGSFANAKNPVIYVHPVMSPSLSGLQKQIITDFEKTYPEIPVHYLEQQFRPHITIAYRDLLYPDFERAWAVYKHKTYKAAFTTYSFWLLQHDGTQWNPIAEHLLIP